MRVAVNQALTYVALPAPIIASLLERLRSGVLDGLRYLRRSIVCRVGQ
jgi:hypothetical protein